MACERHYGIMLAIFVWLWFAVYRNRRGAALWLATAFVLIADFLSPFNFLAAIRVANVLQSYMYFGALLLLGLLLSSQFAFISSARRKPLRA